MTVGGRKLSKLDARGEDDYVVREFTIDHIAIMQKSMQSSNLFNNFYAKDSVEWHQSFCYFCTHSKILKKYQIIVRFRSFLRAAKTSAESSKERRTEIRKRHTITAKVPDALTAALSSPDSIMAVKLGNMYLC